MVLVDHMLIRDDKGKAEGLNFQTVALLAVSVVSATWVLATQFSRQTDTALLATKIYDLTLQLAHTTDAVVSLQEEFANFDSRITGLDTKAYSMDLRVTKIEADRDADKAIHEARAARGIK